MKITIDNITYWHPSKPVYRQRECAHPECRNTLTGLCRVRRLIQTRITDRRWYK